MVAVRRTGISPLGPSSPGNEREARLTGPAAEEAEAGVRAGMHGKFEISGKFQL